MKEYIVYLNDVFHFSSKDITRAKAKAFDLINMNKNFKVQLVEEGKE